MLILNRSLIFFLFAFLTSYVSAQEFSDIDLQSSTVTVTSIGYSNGHCQGGPMGYFCVDQLKRQSRQDAERDASFQCLARQGQLDSWSGQCLDSCFPSMIPDDGRVHFLSCQSQCHFTCRLSTN